MTSPPDRTLSIYGEGKTELGKEVGVATRPTKGVLSLLVHALCRKPSNMLVKRYPIPFLQGKSLSQKVRFAKRQAQRDSDGVVFVMDTEGDRETRIQHLTEGRDGELAGFPMAIGAPHPCIEVWLLAAPGAIRKGMNLAQSPEVLAPLEELSAPRHDRTTNPKTILAACGGKSKGELSATEKDRITTEIRDFQQLKDRCPRSFAPFADEMEQRILPLFLPPQIDETVDQ